jgi:hypothetical protein
MIGQTTRSAFRRRCRVPRARFFAIACVLAAPACGGGETAADRRTVFDPKGVLPGAPVSAQTTTGDVERPYPALDLDPTPGGSRWIGVSVLRGGVRFSRPSRWAIRDASTDPGHAYVEYVSPRAYSFAIYERSDAPHDRWGDVLARYEADVAAVGGKLLGQRIPVATDTNQGRAYTIEREPDGAPEADAAAPTDAAAPPFLSRSREILVRGNHRIVLVQVVSQDDGLSRLSEEISAVLRHLEVL